MKRKSFKRAVVFVLIGFIIGVLLMAGINHAATKSSGDKGYASEWNADHVQNGNHDLEQYSFLNQVIEGRTDFPAGPVEGQIIFRTDLNLLYIYDGSAWGALEGAVTVTKYYSVSTLDFVAGFNNIYTANQCLVYDFGKTINSYGSDVAAWAGVHLPHGAVVTKVVIYGSNAAKTWNLIRTPNNSDAEQSMADANVNTEDNTISLATIDNENYNYGVALTLAHTDAVYGGKITYTITA